MEWYIMKDELPTWTDVAQTVIGTLGIAATVITLWKLMKKDKERESEIANLTLIAQKFAELTELNNTRYKEGKMPIMQIITSTDTDGYYLIEIKNLNKNGKVTNYSKMDSRGLKNTLETGLIENEGEQEFAFYIDTSDDEPFILIMSYTVEHRLLYSQNLEVYKSNGKWIASPGIITLLN
ncbi:hypothetical protein ACFPVY_03950 [Flavobacterium qiangtangense]|uniref:Uncharacterized protein n=1 Tax=Flavobacterium qiangtangense TaxID=1442595 RepID=A0ABW1PKR8_9FLAO